ncbi:MAG: triose-phosphate isomerase [Anaerolineales bacterium]|nr:triose-phosphate isomerase [Anaerolineales bacterium]
MIRTPLAAGNWKMYKTVAETSALLEELKQGLDSISGVEKLVCPPFTALETAFRMLKGSSIHVGAQNVFWEENGAFTGEIAPVMLKELCTFVIIGHSERRIYFGETDETVNRRVKAALAAGLRPIVCVGETLEQNEAGQTDTVVRTQVVNGLAGLSLEQAKGLVIAYEPVWAIGTGKAATPEGANAVIKDSIRSALAEVWDRERADSIRILYGGSIKAGNAATFFSMPDIDGGLVGGASLKAADFIKITEAALE